MSLLRRACQLSQDCIFWENRRRSAQTNAVSFYIQSNRSTDLKCRRQFRVRTATLLGSGMYALHGFELPEPFVRPLGC
jgi:hypothetical protein